MKSIRSGKGRGMLHRNARLLKRLVLWLPLGLLAVVLLVSSDTLFRVSRGVEVLLAVYRDALLLNVDELDADKLMGGGILGMLRELDPYAQYIPDEATEQFQFLTTGDYAGIGAVIQHGEPYATVRQIYEGTPSALAGMREGDTVLAIDGVSMRGKNVQTVSNSLRGKAGSRIEVVLRRPYVVDTVRLSFRRAHIHLPSITYAHRYDDGIGYVHLSTFTTGCAGEVAKALSALEGDSPLRGVVLDLRGNVGGLLDEGVRLASLFLPGGDTVVSVKGRGGRLVEVSTADGKAPYAGVPLAVLVNRESASSSEVVAGALQDRDRAIVIGQRTFGKGLVQTTRPLPYGGIFKLTTAKYYTPSGRCIQAFDYSKRDGNGAVGEIPDSLMSEFYTRCGRRVYDGGGICPDVLVRPEQYSPFVNFLFSHPALFDYATRYRNRHEAIPAATEFRLADGDMQDLLDFLHSRNVPLQNPLLGMMRQLEDLTGDGEQHHVVKRHLDRAAREVVSTFDSCFHLNRTAIAALLSEELASRYYYERGRMARALESDAFFRCAREYLQDSTRLDSVLRYVSPPDPRGERFSLSR